MLCKEYAILSLAICLAYEVLIRHGIRWHNITSGNVFTQVCTNVILKIVSTYICIYVRDPFGRTSQTVTTKLHAVTKSTAYICCSDTSLFVLLTCFVYYHNYSICMIPPLLAPFNPISTTYVCHKHNLEPLDLPAYQALGVNSRTANSPDKFRPCPGKSRNYRWDLGTDWRGVQMACSLQPYYICLRGNGYNEAHKHRVSVAHYTSIT